MKQDNAQVLAARIAGVGFVAPGMDGWTSARAVLAGEQGWTPAPLPRFKPNLLPANERRRATWLVQLALRSVEDCLAAVPELALSGLASVFASSGGDMGNLHGLCEQLARDPKAISPTAFHNSVHNAVAGYFGIGAGARAPSMSLSAHDESFVAGLLEAMAFVADCDSAVLLVCYDMVAPEPLFAKRPVHPDVAVALLLVPVSATAMGATLRISRGKDEARPSVMDDGALEALRLGNPAARALPLLHALACGVQASVIVGERATRWQLQVQP